MATITPAGSAPATPAPATVGNTIDADLAVLKVKVASLETKVVTDAEAAWAWLKANVTHIVGYGAIFAKLKGWL